MIPIITVRTLPTVLLIPILLLASPAAAAREMPELKIDDSAPTRDRGPFQSFSPVVKKASPSVAYVFSTKTVRSPRPDLMPFFMDPNFRRFFGLPDEEEGGGGSRRAPAPQRESREQSLGSGVIVSSDGYIITNNHVIEGADEVRVALDSGKREFVAEVVGRDPKTDLAVLKIDATGLQAATLGDSNKLEVGDVVLAIGNPFGIGLTVTSGIISATGRGGLGIEDYEDFIQTDAAINPGNSGGALVDAQGRVVGINTAILSRTGGFQGVGFAIPVDLARAVMESLVRHGKVTRGFLGVNIQDLSSDLGDAFQVKHGALVTGVTKDSAADAAGLKTGDVITTLNGAEVEDGRRLRLAIGRFPPGTEVKLGVVRDGQTLEITAKLGEQAGETLIASDSSQPEDEGALTGVGVTDIPDQMRTGLSMGPEFKGALVSEVDPNSPSYRAGLREGDVILEINRQRVENAAEAVRLSRETTDKRVLVLLWRGGVSRYVVVDESQPATPRR
jgi:serine protease Do